MTSNGGCAACLLIHSEKWQKANPEKMFKAIAAWEDANRSHKQAMGRQYSKEHQPETAARKRAKRARQLAAKLAARAPDPSDYTGPTITRVDAKAAGLPRYYTGKPCVRGHLSQRVTVNGSCFQCNSEDWERFSHIRRARELGAEGEFTKTEIKELFKYQHGKCIYCAKSLRKGYHVDHIQPLARGGSNWISNIQLLCGPCNNRKGATDPIEFARRNGKLL